MRRLGFTICHTKFMQVETLGDELGGCKRSQVSQVDFQFF